MVKQGMVKQGVTILPPKGGTRTFHTGGLPNQPAKQTVTVFPPKNQIAAATAPSAALTADQLLYCRHLVDKNLGELRAGLAEGADVPDSVKIAEATIVAIDATMSAMTAAAATAAAAAAAAAAAPQPRVVTGARSTQNSASAAPRRIARPASPLPPVAVKMENGQPVPIQPADLPRAQAIDVESTEAQG